MSLEYDNLNPPHNPFPGPSYEPFEQPPWLGGFQYGKWPQGNK